MMKNWRTSKLPVKEYEYANVFPSFDYQMKLDQKDIHPFPKEGKEKGNRRKRGKEGKLQW